MGLHNAVVWTPEMDAQIGTMPDDKLGAKLGIDGQSVRHRRVKLGLPTFRSSRAPQPITCSNCGTTVLRKPKDQHRARRLFCSRACADAGQKRRDSDMLRYGAGWKNRRAEIRRRDKTCRACGKTPKENGGALHVHHLVPFRYGGTNQPENLVALCDPCHHVIEAATNRALASILIDVTLADSFLTVTVEGETRWRGFVRGAGCLTANG